MAEYKASKTQARKLAKLGVAISGSISYRTAGEMLKARGWTEDGRSEDIHDENYRHIED
ncbi:MAG: hypothetical protein V2A73_16670 [Pseudomonadota bacterium]